MYRYGYGNIIYIYIYILALQLSAYDDIFYFVKMFEACQVCIFVVLEIKYIFFMTYSMLLRCL